jgi:hypothetical protein
VESVSRDQQVSSGAQGGPQAKAEDSQDWEGWPQLLPSSFYFCIKHGSFEWYLNYIFCWESTSVGTAVLLPGMWSLSPWLSCAWKSDPIFCLTGFVAGQRIRNTVSEAGDQLSQGWAPNSTSGNGCTKKKKEAMGPDLALLPGIDFIFMRVLVPKSRFFKILDALEVSSHLAWPRGCHFTCFCVLWQEWWQPKECPGGETMSDLPFRVESGLTCLL